jgi:hypothetical protein
MGMWDESCGITHLPILAGDACVIVVLGREALEPREETLGADDLALVKGVYRGTYNGYGWVDGRKADDPGDRAATLAFHGEVWDGIIGGFPGWSAKLGRRATPPAGIAPESADFWRITLFADLTRRDLLGGRFFRGVQDSRTLDAYALADQLTQARTQAHRRHYEEDEE